MKNIINQLNESTVEKIRNIMTNQTHMLLTQKADSIIKKLQKEAYNNPEYMQISLALKTNIIYDDLKFKIMAILQE